MFELPARLARNLKEVEQRRRPDLQLQLLQRQRSHEQACYFSGGQIRHHKEFFHFSAVAAAAPQAD